MNKKCLFLSLVFFILWLATPRVGELCGVLQLQVLVRGCTERSVHKQRQAETRDSRQV